MKLKDLTVSYRENPIGLDELPRFSWKMCGGEQNLAQTAYRIVVTEGKETVWDTGRIDSDQSLFIPYGGRERKAYTTYGIKVFVWDNYGNTDEISGIFETGILDTANWKAKWITHTMEQGESACPVFRGSFPVEQNKVKSARIYASALGVYEMELNGQRVGDAYFAPGWTSYHNRVQYQAYDISDLLRENNVLAITVGNGWYKGYLNCEGKNCFYGDRAAVCAEIRIEYEDGRTDCFVTDEGWTVSTGHIRSSELYMGERQDFTIPQMAQTGAALLGDEAIPGKIVAQESEPVRITVQIPAQKMFRTPKGETVIDFGQNMAGFVRVRLPKLQGDMLRIRHAESLDKDGNFYVENLRSAASVDEYVYSGEDVGRTAAPHFTYHGFRYICVEGAADVNADDFTACALHTDMKKTGKFTCSHEKVDRLQQNIEWGQRSNFFDIPTDCPQRDERLGWTGDAQIFSATAMYNFNAALFYKKWLRDVAAETDDEHGVPHIVPNIVGPATGTAIWSDCATIIPWNLYRAYGDISVLEEQYGNMKQWVEYIRRACGKDILWMNGFQRGDWLSLDSDESLHLMSGGTDKNLVANVYYAYSVRILRDTAEALGKEEDRKEYAGLYETIAEGINQEYVTPNGRLVTETQTACALLLYFDLLAPKYRKRVIRALGDNLAAHNGHLTTGFAGTAYLSHALSENGLHRQAEELLLTEEYLGWLYAVNMGATTIWERWNSILPNGDFDTSGMNSLNHYSYGSIGDWLYRRVAGIDCLEPGYKKILIRPTLTKGLSRVEASFESMYGTVSCNLCCADGKITVDIEIPPNTTAQIELPEKDEILQVGSGKYHYEYETSVCLDVEKYTMNSKMGELLEADGAFDIVEKYMPGMRQNPMLDYLKGRSLNELVRMAPQQKELLEQLLEEMNGNSHT